MMLGQQGRPAAGQRVPGGRHLADRHGAVGEAQHRAGDPGVGSGDLHPVQQVRDGLPARGHPREGLSTRPLLDDAPPTFKSMDFKGDEFKGMKYTIQVAPEDCTGCTLCVDGLPGQGQSRIPSTRRSTWTPQRAAARSRARELRLLPRPARSRPHDGASSTSRASQFLQPLFEYSGACAGCGETPYVKLLTQLFGDRALIANATGCSSIYGGNLPTTPYTVNRDGRGPAWSNSLFEDNAEFGFGFRLAIDKQTEQARELAPCNWPAELGDDAGRRAAQGRPVQAKRASPSSATRVAALQQKLAGDRRRRRRRLAGDARRLPGAQERLDRRRRRLGLRHRLRRPRPRAGHGPRRQHPGARHRGLLEHRRSGSPRPRRSARRPSSRGRARRRARRTSA